ncbi:MAG: phosphonate C-P lyase system protein PhnL [Acidobacteria bacterium]|nr:phosphonate C-P lyase system protein PhnL [Acidobacteriota bacterium]
MNAPALVLEGLSKSFTLHERGGVELRVLDDVSLEVRPGECVVLQGPSGMGKSTLLRLAYGNYKARTGRILVRDGDELVDVASAPPRRVLALRRGTLGYVSQFLRVIPRTSTLEIVAHAARRAGFDAPRAEARARAALSHLALPERLWELPPATFSGGEQQRVNIARTFAADYPILLLDEPTASLDAANAARVLDLVRGARDRGAAILAIFHDRDAAVAVADRFFDLSAARQAV